MFCKTEDPLALLPNFLYLSSLPFDLRTTLLLSLWSIKEPGIQTQIRWLFWGASLPSLRSAGFPNKVIFLASTPRLLDSLACLVASRMSLDSVTIWLSQPGSLLLVASWPWSGHIGTICPKGLFFKILCSGTGCPRCLAVETRNQQTSKSWLYCKRVREGTLQEQITFNEARRGSSQISELLH